MKGACMNRVDSNLDIVKYNKDDGAPLKEKIISYLVTKQARVITELLRIADIPWAVYRDLKI